ncbi:response regulator transcription factor [Terrarubrum flagellatum]|uniref:response regulator transcription factor n=1 Tax=Terrirubrum flagellatum TaxID=2895980 RepID=UPI003144EB02
MTASLTRIIIADDHPLVRGALRQAVETRFKPAEVVEVGVFEEAVAAIDRLQEIDLLLLDLAMPGVEGFSGLMYLRAQHPSVPVVIVSANDDPGVIRRALGFGASGFIPKTVAMDTMTEALGVVLNGGVWTPPDVDLLQPVDQETGELVKKLATLTPQQVRVLMMLSQGLLNKQIAFELSVSEATVKAHVSAILQKLGVDSRTQAVIAAAKIAAAGTTG